MVPAGWKDGVGRIVEECCQREVFEETGLEIQTRRLVGIYSNRDQLVIYPDGNKVQIVVLSFEAEVTGGKLGLSDETTAAAYYDPSEMESMPMHGRHMERVHDALANLSLPVIR